MHTLHIEPHAFSSKLSEIILGGQDGLVNVLGVILGVATASGEIRIILAAGLAATFAESISMAAALYTSGLADKAHYEAELVREKREMKEVPEVERQEIRDIYKAKGFEGKLLEDIVKHITADEKLWLTTMMTEELNLLPVHTKDIVNNSLIVGLAVAIGSLIPLAPFFVLPVHQGIIVAIVLSSFSLFAIGIYKAKATLGKPVKSGLEMAIIGMGAAVVGYVIGLLFKAPV